MNPLISLSGIHSFGEKQKRPRKRIVDKLNSIVVHPNKEQIDSFSLENPVISIQNMSNAEIESFPTLLSTYFNLDTVQFNHFLPLLDSPPKIDYPSFREFWTNVSIVYDSIFKHREEPMNKQQLDELKNDFESKNLYQLSLLKSQHSNQLEYSSSGPVDPNSVFGSLLFHLDARIAKLSLVKIWKERIIQDYTKFLTIFKHKLSLQDSVTEILKKNTGKDSQNSGNPTYTFHPSVGSLDLISKRKLKPISDIPLIHFTPRIIRISSIPDHENGSDPTLILSASQDLAKLERTMEVALQEEFIVWKSKMELQLEAGSSHSIKRENEFMEMMEGNFEEELDENVVKLDPSTEVEIPVKPGEYGLRKPKSFNSMTTGVEWTDFHRMKYSEENPPPTQVLGYSFCIFYPDIDDKFHTPSFTVSELENTTSKVRITFSAGKPYRDVAFLIENREWLKKAHLGYVCEYFNGIFQLKFRFRTANYRGND